MTDAHTHHWKIDTSRTHGRPGRYFVICTGCPETAQATIQHGFFNVFETSVDRGGPSDTVTSRLKLWEIAAVKLSGISHSEIFRAGMKVLGIIK